MPEELTVPDSTTPPADIEPTAPETPATEAVPESTDTDDTTGGALFEGDKEVGAFLADDADDLDPDETPPVPETPPSEGKEPAAATKPDDVKPAAEPTPEGDKTPAPAATPEVKPTVQEPTPAETPAEPTPTPEAPVAQAQPTIEELQKTFRESREEAVNLLATQHYALDEETAEALAADASTVIPKLMARVQMDAVQVSLSHMAANLPRMVEQALKMRETDNSAEEKFFEAWPQLDRTKHTVTVQKLGAAYRQMNPTATLDEFIQHVGASTMVAHKISPEPVTPVTPEPAAAQPAKPFKPAGSSPPSGSPAPQTNPFAKMSDDFEAENLDLD